MNIEKFLFDLSSEFQEMQKNGRSCEMIYALEKISVQVLNLLGNAYGDFLSQHQKAIELYQTALIIDPTDCDTCNNIVYDSMFMEDYEKASLASERQIRISENNAFSYFNAGVLKMCQNKPLEAIQMYKKAIDLNPNDFSSILNSALCKLKIETCQEAWDDFEFRFESSQLMKKSKSRFLIPEWNGEDLKNKTIYVYNEQGVGDFIFYARFIPMIKKFGGKVKVEIQKILSSIIGYNLKIDQIIYQKDNIIDSSEADFFVSVCSLPRILKINSEDKIPKDPYFFSCDKSMPEFFDKDKFKIGICWAGNQNHKFDYTRSTFFKYWSNVFEVPNAQVFNLVKGISGFRKWPTGMVNLHDGIENFPIINLENYINDFGDLMHYVNHLDLVVTIDTALANLAGAMGKRTWLLVGDVVDWRWGLDKEFTPWYPSIKIFQKKHSFKIALEDIFYNLKKEQIEKAGI
jgi:tetratricopeptide (TPR) repeat protein